MFWKLSLSKYGNELRKAESMGYLTSTLLKYKEATHLFYWTEGKKEMKFLNWESVDWQIKFH
jgi:hypothetical protein